MRGHPTTKRPRRNPNAITTMSTTVQESVPFLDQVYSLLLWILIGLVIIVAGFQVVRKDSLISRQNPSSSSDPVELQSSPKESFSGNKKPGQTSESSGVSKVSDDENNNNNNKWRCACEGGFLPPGLLKTFGGAEAVLRLGSGQCYHKKL